MQKMQDAPVRFGSVCSGIEAASVAFSPLGWEAAWFSEIEPSPSKVLAHHYPDVPNLGDMTALPARIAAGEVEAPDVLCGGTPCQAFSVAGLRKSLGDIRGNLSLTFCEIANAIDSKRRESGKPPAIVFWENVPGVLNTSDNAFGCLLGALAGEDDPLEPAGGKWSNAGCVFGPERAIAWRVLDAQHFGVPQRRKRIFLVACSLERAHPTPILFEFEGVRRDSAPSRPEGEAVAPAVTSGAPNGGPGHGARSGSAKEGPIVPQPFELANCLTQRMHKGINTTLDEGHTPVLAFPANLSGTQHVGEAAMPSLMAKNPTAIAFQASQSGMRTSGVHATLDANNGMRRHTGVLEGLQVRKLMPVECERLMGFPDFYTEIPGSSDTGRYKALGNSWAVPVVHWIGSRVNAALASRSEAL